MFIEIVHVNGRYSPEIGEHIPPTHMPEDYYDKLTSILAVAASKGASLIYRPNLTSFTHDVFADPAELERARNTDPFLRVFKSKNDTLSVRPDGIRPLGLVEEDVALEDALVRRHGVAVILGAYTKWCVPAVAHNIASRNPAFRVGIDTGLSIDNGGNYVELAHANVPHISVARFIEEK